MELPIYKALISDDFDSPLQIEAVAFVDKPAIERNFMAFREHRRLTFSDEKRIVSGPAMLSDYPIYRNIEGIGEFFLVFDKHTILSMVQKFFRKGFAQSFNLFHDQKQKVADVTIYESFITDSERGIAPPKGFEDAADGSWFISAKIDNEEVWQRVKSGEVKGFSIEGLFDQTPIGMAVTRDQQLAAIEKIVESMDPDIALAKICEVLNCTI